MPTDDVDDLNRTLELRDAVIEEELDAILRSLWLFEIANTLGRKFPDQAPALVASLVGLAIPEWKPDNRWLNTGLELTSTYDVAFYDAS